MVSFFFTYKAFIASKYIWILENPYSSLCYRVQYHWKPRSDADLEVNAGDYVTILDQHESGWWNVRDDAGNEGTVPSNYLEQTESPLFSHADVSHREKNVMLRLFLAGLRQASNSSSWTSAAGETAESQIGEKGNDAREKKVSSSTATASRLSRISYFFIIVNTWTQQT